MRKQLRALIVAGAGIFAFVTLLPVIWGLVTSLKAKDQIFKVDAPWKLTPTLENYDAVLSGAFVRAFLVSLAYSLLATVLALLFSILAAYALDRLRFPFRQAVYNVLIACVPLSIGAAVLVVPNYLYLSALNMTNSWYTLPLWYIGLNIPIATWILKGSFESLPTALDDAAKLDGLGHWGIIWKVLFPLIRPGLFAAGLMVFIGSWNEFVAGSVFVQDSALRPVQVAVYQYISAYGRQWGPLSAAALLAVVPMFIFVARYGRNLVSGLTKGATK